MPQIPAGWEETTLQLCTLPVQEKISLTQVSEDNYISTENMLPNIWWVVISSGLPNINSITKFQKWDILFSNIRPYFRKLWYATFTGGVSNDVLVFRGNYSKIYSKFLFYRLLDNSFFDYTIKTSKWTKMPRWDKEAIWNFPIHLPPLPEQQAIAAVLSSFDDKIELLRAENQTLEQMGQELFKERFGKWKVGDELPEGWRVGKLGEEFDISIGRTPPRAESEWFSNKPIGKKWISIKDMVNSWIYIFNTSEFLTDEAIAKFNIPIIPNNTTILSFKMTVGKLAITTEDMLSNEAIAHFKLKSNSVLSSEFIYCYLSNLDFNSLWSTSSIVTAINSTIIKELSCIIPDQETLSKFDLVIKPLFNKIRANSEQIQTLSATRDQLLPKLMSGELRVEF